MTAAELRARAREHEALARHHEEQARECRRRASLDDGSAAILDAGLSLHEIVVAAFFRSRRRAVLVGHDGVSPQVRLILASGSLSQRTYSAWSMTPTGERWEGQW